MNHLKKSSLLTFGASSFLFAGFLLTGLSFAGAVDVPSTPAKDRMVVVISLDGFPAYDLDNPKLPVPTLRALIKKGAWAKAMQPVNPTWTWPNHTTMVTGLHPAEHGLFYNGALIRKDDPLSVSVDWTIPKEKMVYTKTIYDIAHERGLTTAQVDWVAINDAPTINWAFPEKAKPSDALIREMVAKGALTNEDISNEGSPSILWRDQIWTKAGSYIIREHKPNLLLFHLLSLDSTHHTYGVKTLASYDAIAFLDSCVKQLVEATEQAGMTDKATFVVVSDHGFRTVETQIRLKNLLVAAKLDQHVAAVPEGGSAMVYVDKTNRKELLEKLRTIFSSTEGVERVADESQFPSLGYPMPEKEAQMPDLVVFAKPGYGFSGGKGDDGPAVQKNDHPTGSHGYINTDPDMQAIFIAAGYGIRPGVKIDQIQNTSVAPTLAKLLGLQLPKSDGAPVGPILQ